MKIIPNAEAETFALGDVEFRSFVRPGVGSRELCGWRLELPPRAAGAVHRVNKEEVLLVLDGAVEAHTGGQARRAEAGDVLLIAPEEDFSLSNPEDRPAAIWTVAGVGLEGAFPDGSTITPPWTL